MAVGPRRYRSHAAHRGLVEGQSAEAPNLFWMCAGKMSAQSRCNPGGISGPIQPPIPVDSGSPVPAEPPSVVATVPRRSKVTKGMA